MCSQRGREHPEESLRVFSYPPLEFDKVDTVLDTKNEGLGPRSTFSSRCFCFEMIRKKKRKKKKSSQVGDFLGLFVRGGAQKEADLIAGFVDLGREKALHGRVRDDELGEVHTRVDLVIQVFQS